MLNLIIDRQVYNYSFPFVKELFQFVQLLIWKFGDFDLESNMKVAFLIRVNNWHALTFDDLDRAWLGDSFFLNLDLSAIEVLETFFES